MKKVLIIYSTILLLLSYSSNMQSQDKNVVDNSPETYAENTLHYHRDEIVRNEQKIGLPNNQKDDFIIGIKSPYTPYTWFYSSRNSLSEPTSLYKYNSKNRHNIELISKEDTPSKNLSFNPIAFGDTPNIIYLEANDYIKGSYSLGVWKYNLTTKVFTKLAITDKYMMTPVIDTNRHYLYYTGTSQSTRNLVHGRADKIFRYDLLLDIEQELNKSFQLVEVSRDGSLKSGIDNCLPAINTSVSYFFPYTEGQYFCMGRQGSIPPCPNDLPPGSGCNSHAECPHGFDPYGGVDGSTCTDRNLPTDYIAFDVENSDTHNDIYAAASGIVTFADIQSGYGRCIEIKHADGYSTFYAHLSSINVDVNDYITHLNVIGKEGGSNYKNGTLYDSGPNAYGEHLHFEVRAQAGVRGSDYVSFREFFKAENGGMQPANYRNAGFALAKPPIPTFVSNIDLTPNCGAIGINQLNNSITISNLHVSNLGDASADGFKIFFSLKNANDKIDLGVQAISQLDEFSTIAAPSVFFPIQDVPSGDYYLEVYVATDNFLINPSPLAEYDLNNNDCTSNSQITISNSSPTCSDGIQNQGEFDVDCGGPCPPCQTPVNLKSTACATPIVNGDQVTILYEIMNTGSINSGPFYTGWYLREVGSPNFSSFAVLAYHLGINAGTSEPLSVVFDLEYWMNFSNLSAGDYELYMSIDVLNGVTESNESDNWCTNNSTLSYNSCDPNGNFQGAYNGMFNYAAPNYINAPASGNQCTILPNSDVTLQAGNYVILNPGFVAEYNSTFHAFIDDCGGAMIVAEEGEETPDNITTENINFKLTQENIDIAIRNYPNPFTGQTTIEYNLSDDSSVMLVVTDLTGKQIAVLENNEQKTKGVHTVSFDGSNYPAGMYYYTIQAGEYMETQKMILMK